MIDLVSQNAVTALPCRRALIASVGEPDGSVCGETSFDGMA